MIALNLLGGILVGLTLGAGAVALVARVQKPGSGSAPETVEGPSCGLPEVVLRLHAAQAREAALLDAEREATLRDEDFRILLDLVLLEVEEILDSGDTPLDVCAGFVSLEDSVQEYGLEWTTERWGEFLRRREASYRISEERCAAMGHAWDSSRLWVRICGRCGRLERSEGKSTETRGKG